MNWKEKEPTQKQIECIQSMMEFSDYQIPRFTGTTRGEASDYIDKYGKIAHENVDYPRYLLYTEDLEVYREMEEF